MAMNNDLDIEITGYLAKRLMVAATLMLAEMSMTLHVLPDSEIISQYVA
jgi:hypothetical protein